MQLFVFEIPLMVGVLEGLTFQITTPRICSEIIFTPLAVFLFPIISFFIFQGNNIEGSRLSQVLIIPLI